MKNKTLFIVLLIIIPLLIVISVSLITNLKYKEIYFTFIFLSVIFGIYYFLKRKK
jgi:hypothetical protein